MWNRRKIRAVRISGDRNNIISGILSFYELMKNSGALKDFKSCPLIAEDALMLSMETELKEILLQNPDIIVKKFSELLESADQQDRTKSKYSIPGMVVLMPDDIRNINRNYKKIFKMAETLICLAGGNFSWNVLKKIPAWSILFTNLQTELQL